MLSFAALQVKPGESDQEVVKRFFEVAAGLGLEFKNLEPYGVFTLGIVKLFRFQTDCPALHKLVPVFQEENRAFVLPGVLGYRYVTLAVEGKAPVTVMQGSKLPGYSRKYYGTSNKFWERQFA